MSTIQNLFQQAQLAEAAYANFINPDTGKIYNTQAGIQAALIASGFSGDQGNPPQSSQASAFLNEWEVIDQISDTASGFSATVFKNIKVGDPDYGKYTLAIRGSLQPVDFYEDANLIVRDGVAVNQLIDLYNYWQSLTHTGPYQAAYLETNIAQSALLTPLWTASVASPLATPAYEATKAALEAVGYIVQGGIVSSVEFGNSDVKLAGTELATGSGAMIGHSLEDVVGHSLGGHLSMAFTRLFPSVGADAVAINGLGFKIGD